jgi:predicted small metal-binding protein
VAKEFACGEIVDGCSFTAGAGTEDELLTKVTDHARHAHDIRDITPDLAAKVKAAIKER